MGATEPELPRTRRVRELVRAAARRTGTEVALERAYLAAARALEPASVRRNRLDDERLRLLAAAVLTDDSSCIDVGANAGQLLEVFVDIAPNGRHIAYEPVPELSAALRRRFPAVDVRAAAVGDQCGESTFVVHRRLPSRSSLRSVGYDAQDTETIRVPVERLDDCLPASFVPRLIKIDVEGAEHLVLSGARRTLLSYRPVVVFEHQRSTAGHYGTGPEEVHRLLNGECGMRIFDMDGRGPYSEAELCSAYASGRRWNFFAVPAVIPVS